MKRLMTMLLILVSQGSFAQNVCDYSCAPECKRYAEQLLFKAGEIATRCGFALQPPGPVPSGSMEMYSSPFCSFEVVATADYYTNCRALAGINESIRGIRVQGQCLETERYSAENICWAYKATTVSGHVRFFRNAFCSTGFVAAAADKAHCDSVSQAIGPVRVASMWMNGRCTQIASSDFLSACRRFAR